MDLSLTDEQDALREGFTALFAKESSPERVRAAEPLGFDPALWRALRATGVPHAALGAPLLDLALVAEPAGRHLAPAPLVEAIVAMRVLGDDRGATLPTVALRGPRLVPWGAVSDLVVALDGDDLVAVRGAATGGALANLGDTPIADRDLRAGEREVVASGTEAGERFGRALDEWRALTAAALAGLAAGALDLAVAYVGEREQFGVPIGSFQSVQHALAEVATAVDGARLLAFEAAWALDAEPDRGAALASMAFAFAARTAQDAAAAALHFHGGYGFMVEYEAQLFFRRAKAWALAGGDPRRELLHLADLLHGPVAG